MKARPPGGQSLTRELHLVHALAGVPVEEGLAAEHGRELLAHALEHLLDGGAARNRADTAQPDVGECFLPWALTPSVG